MQRDVVPVSEARARLTATLRGFRDGTAVEPVVIGSHRHAEAVLMPYADYVRRESPPTPARIRDVLHEYSDTIARLAMANSLENVRVFGSVARGDDTPSSDVDLLVSTLGSAGISDLTRFADDVERLIGRAVDVVVDGELRSGGLIADHIAASAQAL